ncbi:MAG: 3-oxoacyl-ACP synthase III family protein, partial [Terriglobales bacterium]
MRYAKIVGTGMYVPEKCVTNDELRVRLAHVPEFVDKMEAGTGIKQRFHAPEDWATSDLALRAAEQALKNAGRKPEDVDLIILGTDSPDYITPSTSVVVQHKLGAKRAGTFDVGCACASFPTGLSIASGIIASNPAMKTIVVIGVYLMHKLADPKDPFIFFYGDGASAAVVEGGDKPGFITAAYQADGAYAKFWGIFAGGTAEPASCDAVSAGRTKVQILDRYPPEINDDGWPKLARTLGEQGGFQMSDVDLFIFTQVRKPTIELVMQKLGAPMERTHTIMEEYGYTGSACVGMALHDAITKKKIHKDDLVVLIGSGVGYNQA